MIAVVRVTTAATALFPAIHADRIAVINGEQAWIATLVEETAESRGRSHLEVIARNGPRWGPGVLVDIVLELRDAGGQARLVRVPGQKIQRTN